MLSIHVNVHFLFFQLIGRLWERNVPGARRINKTDYIIELSTHLYLSWVEVLNKYRTIKQKERKKRGWKTALNGKGKQTPNICHRSSVATATGNVMDTNIGKLRCSVSSTGITCIEKHAELGDD